MQLEDEIATLHQVLAAKEKHLVEIKQKLGINLMNELKQNFSKSWHDVQTTTAWVQIRSLLSSSYITCIDIQNLWWNRFDFQNLMFIYHSIMTLPGMLFCWLGLSHGALLRFKTKELSSLSTYALRNNCGMPSLCGMLCIFWGKWSCCLATPCQWKSIEINLSGTEKTEPAMSQGCIAV